MSDAKNYPRIMTRASDSISELSPYSVEGVNANQRASSSLREHIKATDAAEQTAIMIQEQNEAGALDTVRCFLSESNKIFDGQVSDCLVRAMHKRPGTWQEVFGKDADESFSTLGDFTLDQRGREGRKSGVPAAHGCECMAGYAGWPDASGVRLPERRPGF